MKTLNVLPGEGETTTVTTKKMRQTCEECGEVAHFKHTWLLSGTRSNPASKAYGRDDCSWCEDECSYACPDCTSKIGPPDGYVTCSVFPANDQFAHMFLYDKKLKE